MRRIAIIPARGGSKRIPRKNVKIFIDKPIIAYSIEVALKSGLFEEVMVSTDDPEIAAVAERYGAKVPFLRSENNSGDFATLADVISEVLSKYEVLGTHFDVFCCILATSPFLLFERIQEAYGRMVERDFDSVFPVLRFSYPIQRSLEIQNEKIGLVYPEYRNSRSQDLEPRYHDSGQFYWMWSDRFRQQQTLFAKNSGAIVLKEWEVQDIDTEEDWKMAEIKYRLLQNG
ncbi:MAG: pseudaminic acid cytidylyltransferase [Bacteroidales bacterium]